MELYGMSAEAELVTTLSVVLAPDARTRQAQQAARPAQEVVSSVVLATPSSDSNDLLFFPSASTFWLSVKESSHGFHIITA
jgi:hypothetical protein